MVHLIEQRQNDEQIHLLIEEGKERHVTSYLRQWTQLIRLHGQGVLKCGCTGKTIALLVQSDQMCSIGADMTSATSLSLSIYNLLLYGRLLAEIGLP